MRINEFWFFILFSLFSALLVIILIQADKIRRQKSTKNPFARAFFFCERSYSIFQGEIELKTSEADLPVALAELAFSSEKTPFSVDVINSQPFFYISFEVFSKYSVSAIRAESMKVSSVRLVLNCCSVSSIYLPDCKSIYISIRDCPNLERIVFLGAPPELCYPDDCDLCNVSPDFAFHVAAKHLEAYRDSDFARLCVRDAEYNRNPVRILEREPVFVRV